MKTLSILLLSALCAFSQSTWRNVAFVGSLNVNAEVASGTVYFVDATRGSDTNSGLAEGAALKTLQAATNLTLAAGDTVKLKRGERWYERFIFPRSAVTLADYGTGTLPIIDGGTTNVALVDCGVRSNTVTRNLYICNAGGDNKPLWNNAVGTNYIYGCVVSNHTYSTQGDGIGGGGDCHTIVSNCVICKTSDDGFSLHTTASGEIYNSTFWACANAINNSGTDMQLVVEDCTFRSNSVAAGPLSKGLMTFRRCRFDYPVTDGKFYTSDGYDITTFDYCIFDATAAPSIAMGNLIGSTNTVFRNCVFAGVDTGSFSIGPGRNIYLTNCIFADWWRAAYLEAGATFTMDHCVFYSVSSSNATTTASMLTANPLLVSPATGDMRLSTGSPAINAGVDVGLTTDFARNPVGDPPEIGSYEF